MVISKKDESIISAMIEIQCPDCGTMLKINEMREYYCKDCERELSESEIRDRCAL